MGRATARAPIEKPSALKAPLFKLLVDELDASSRHVALDLGAVSTQMLSLLAGYRCCVEVADVVRNGGLEQLNADQAQNERCAAAELLLPRHRVGDPVDLVYCWDLLNYLKPEAISALAAAIRTRAEPHARAHALIFYSERTMPDRPGRWVPAENGVLVDQANASPAMIAAPRYSPELLVRIMGGVVIEHARLLANGMQEFVFRFGK
jgi:hypothetical protein